MAFKVYFKRDLSGETLVSITDNNGTNIQRIIKGEHTDTEEETLVKLVLEQFYQEVYPNRAENERFAKVDEKLQLIDKKLAEMDKVKKELDVTQGSVMELITQLGDKLAKGDGQHEEAEKTQENGKGGENNDGNVIRN
jgi:hypothetical protein